MELDYLASLLFIAACYHGYQVNGRTCAPGRLEYQHNDGVICCKPTNCTRGNYVSRCLANNTEEKCLGCDKGTALEYNTSSFNRMKCYPIPQCKKDFTQPAYVPVNGTHCACMWTVGHIKKEQETNDFSGLFINCQKRSTNCSAGEEPNIFVDGCSPCKHGFYKTDKDYSMCKAWRNCSLLGMVEETAGNLTKDAVCTIPPSPKNTKKNTIPIPGPVTSTASTVTKTTPRVGDIVTPSETKGLSTGAIIGIIVCILVLVLAVVIVRKCIYPRWRNRSRRHGRDRPQVYDEEKGEQDQNLLDSLPNNTNNDSSIGHQTIETELTSLNGQSLPNGMNQNGYANSMASRNGNAGLVSIGTNSHSTSNSANGSLNGIVQNPSKPVSNSNSGVSVANGVSHGNGYSEKNVAHENLGNETDPELYLVRQHDCSSNTNMGCASSLNSIGGPYDQTIQKGTTENSGNNHVSSNQQSYNNVTDDEKISSVRSPTDMNHQTSPKFVRTEDGNESVVDGATGKSPLGVENKKTLKNDTRKGDDEKCSVIEETQRAKADQFDTDRKDDHELDETRSAIESSQREKAEQFDTKEKNNNENGGAIAKAQSEKEKQFDSEKKNDHENGGAIAKAQSEKEKQLDSKVNNEQNNYSEIERIQGEEAMKFGNKDNDQDIPAEISPNVNTTRDASYFNELDKDNLTFQQPQALSFRVNDVENQTVPKFDELLTSESIDPTSPDETEPKTVVTHRTISSNSNTSGQLPNSPITSETTSKPLALVQPTRQRTGDEENGRHPAEHSDNSPSSVPSTSIDINVNHPPLRTGGSLSDELGSSETRASQDQN